jgi:capsular polysaccharide export protein
MGFEAILVGKKCVCFGMPFYAGWGVTDDRVRCDRRKKKLGTEEIFAGAYILYTRYYNPYQKRPSDIFDTIDEIIKQKKVI